MQLLSGHRSVFARSKHDKLSTRIERHPGKSPLVECEGIVCKVPPSQINCCPGYARQFDPIGVIAILVGKTAGIDRQELANDDLSSVCQKRTSTQVAEYEYERADGRGLGAHLWENPTNQIVVEPLQQLHSPPGRNAPILATFGAGTQVRYRQNQGGRWRRARE